MVHFRIPAGTSTQTFMAYGYKGQIYVRADVCVPCQSINFALKGNLLVCMSCGTTFDVLTCKGTGTVGSSACRKYPKDAVSFRIQDGQLVMNTGDLNTAYQNTVTIN